MVMTPLWIVCLHILLVNGNGCPKEEELRKYMESLALDVDLQKLEGTWMVVEASEDNVEGASASTFQFKLDADGVTMKVKGADYMTAGGKEEYSEAFSKKTEGPKGVLKWTGNYDDGEAYTRDGFIYYHDENALAIYTCDCNNGYIQDSLVLVNAAKIRDVQDSTENEAKTSMQKAQAQLTKIKTKDDEWKNTHKGSDGLLGETIVVDLKLLKPEV